MAATIIQPSFAVGEVSPSLFGRVDLAKFHVGCATMRNFYVNYKGGASSRAGTKFIGNSREVPSANNTPPRLIRFQFNLEQGLVLEFGNLYMRVISNGAYVTDATKVITGITQAAQAVVTVAAHGYQNTDDVFIDNVVGMTQVNGNTYKVANVTTNTFKIKDIFGNYIDSTTFGAYVSGGTAARYYALATPYAVADLPSLKYTQSADTMTLVHPSYPIYDLVRVAANNWTLTPTVIGTNVTAPSGLTATATTLVTGTILSLTVTNHGTGYSTQAVPLVTFNSTTGTGAAATLVVDETSGFVLSSFMTANGSGYDPADTATVTNSVGGAGSGCTAAINVGDATALPTEYQYVVTAVDTVTGQESVASNIASVNSVNISQTQGSIALTWNAVAGASSYRVYRAPEAYGNDVPTGSLFGFVGTALGNSFVDNNIIPDFVTTPPLSINPFAPGAILSITMTNQGSGYTSEPAVSVTTSTGSGALFRSIVIGGKVQAVSIVNTGHNYAPGDTIGFSGGGGASAAGTLVIGPATGTYPGVVAYFQQRRVYANTNNNPDTYWMSQTGLFDNFDSSIIPLDSDAITGTPWAQQVNGIQSLVAMPSGLIILTGLGAWQLTGVSSSAVTPTSQNAQPQAYNGCHNQIQPIVVNYDILYVQSKGSIVRDLAYNVFVNIYTGTDITLLSSHLFTGFSLVEWAWAEEPYKVMWMVREDGKLLSMTYLKEQDISGFARHDTEGLFKSVTSVTEVVATSISTLTTDAVYVVVQRLVNGQWFYFVERMDDRLWPTLEDSWCLDAALALTQPTPNATLTASQSALPGKIGSVAVVTGGAGYTSPNIIVDDPTGTGAVVTATLTLGVITAFNVVSPGAGYTSPHLRIQDATGSGAVGAFTFNNDITFSANSAIFSSANIGDVIRMGGGVAQVTSIVGGNAGVHATLIAPITSVIPNDPDNTPLPAYPNQWTITTPVTTVTGLSHLEGKAVKALADGNVVEDLVVTNGAVTLPMAASSIVIGLPFVAQVQSLYTDIPGEPTVQGKRKNIYAVTVRVQGSRGLRVGSNQVDSSTQENYAVVPWTNLKEIKERSNQINAGVAIPLFTGDERINIPANWAKPGQVAVEQDNPLPANLLAFLPEVVLGDSNG